MLLLNQGVSLKKRHQHFYDLLKEELTESPGKEVCQDEVLRILKLGTKPEDKRIATKAVRDTFATAQVSHRKHVKRSLPYQLDDNSEINQPQQGSEIASLKNKIKISSDQISAWQKEIQDVTTSVDDTDPHYLQVALQMYENEVEKFTVLHEQFDCIYEKQISKLLKRNTSSKLPESTREKLSEELDYLAGRVNLGLRNVEQQLDFAFTDLNLDELRIDFTKECPILFDVMRTLFPTDKNEYSRNKEMSFVHAFSILTSLKNKDLKNDFKFFFSVLLMSFGVGCKLMYMLSKMGLTTAGTLLTIY